MRKKCNRLVRWSFALALGIFTWSYILYHYATPDGGLSLVWRAEPAKPMVTLLFAVWGVMFLFSGVMGLLVGHIFFPRETEKES